MLKRVVPRMLAGVKRSCKFLLVRGSLHCSTPELQSFPKMCALTFQQPTKAHHQPVAWQAPLRVGVSVIVGAAEALRILRVPQNEPTSSEKRALPFKSEEYKQTAHESWVYGKPESYTLQRLSRLASDPPKQPARGTRAAAVEWPPFPKPSPCLGSRPCSLSSRRQADEDSTGLPVRFGMLRKRSVSKLETSNQTKKIIAWHATLHTHLNHNMQKRRCELHATPVPCDVVEQNTTRGLRRVWIQGTEVEHVRQDQAANKKHHADNEDAGVEHILFCWLFSCSTRHRNSQLETGPRKNQS